MGKAKTMPEQREYDPAVKDLIEMVKILRTDLREQHRINTELISVLSDLRGELQHMRTQRERDDRFQNLADEARALASKTKRNKRKPH